MRVQALYRYPVKSMLGHEVEQAQVSDRGVLGDRAYGLVDLADGTVASAKHPRKWGALLEFSARLVDEPVPGGSMPPVAVTFPDGSVRRSDQPGTDAALSAVLGRQVRLTSPAPSGSRFQEQWPAIEGLAPQQFIDSTTTGAEGGEPVSAIELAMLAPPGTFFDLAPLHVLSTATLAELTRLAPGPHFDVRRYRPNVLVADAPEGFADESWVGGVLALGDQVRAGVSMLTMRCVMTTLAQGDLAQDRDTLRAVATHARREIPGLGSWACAGVYAQVRAGGTVRRGDAVSTG
ncbi:MAG: hypothetical protein JWN57_2612 [Frankiales bacterium]|jgi:uncharacterized protein YcbX|nr:hypothetical protein [Frankiales bacterium]